MTARGTAGSPTGLNTSNTPVIQTGRTYPDRPLIRRVTNSEIQEKEKNEADQKEFELAQQQPVVLRLASHVRAAFSSAVQAKATIMERMLMCLRQREGIYEADIEALIREQGGTTIYMLLTDVKCRALESWLKDIMLPSGERPYSIEPTPVPDIPPQFVEKAQKHFLQDYLQRVAVQAQADGQQFDPSMINKDDLREAAEKFKDELLQQIREQAKQDADAIENNVDDELVEGKWYDALGDMIEDFATYPTAFVEGPVFRRRQTLQWIPVAGTLLSQISVADKIVKEYDRLDPFDVYPAAGAKTIQDGDLCIRKRFSRRDLDVLRGVDGFDTNAINQVLVRYANGYKEFIAYDTEIATPHDRPNESTDPEGHIDGIKFYGSVQGFMLREWGMTIKQVPDPYKEYPIIAYTVGPYVIGARINPHPLGRRNIYSASFRKKNGSIWGKSVPETMRDVQNICNSAARAICNNAAMASGPQVWQLVDLIPAECDRTNIHPWKIWEYSSEKLKSAGHDPMGFFQPELIVNELLGLYKHFFDQGSEVTGIPAYIYGNEKIGGAGATASGLSMLMNAAAKGLRNAAGNIDKGIISPSVEEHWLIIMLTRPDLARGDCKIVARASEYLVQQEQLQMRRAEVLDKTNNPTDLSIMGIDGRSELLRENFKSLKMNVDKLIPRREDMIATKIQQEVQNVVTRLAEALNVQPEQLMAVLDGQAKTIGPGGARGVKESIAFKDLPPEGKVQMAAQAGIKLKPGDAQELGPDGQPMAGKDIRQFNPPGRAEGGSVEAGKPFVVGEKGPEVFVPDQNGTVIPNQDSSVDPNAILDQVLSENKGLAKTHSPDDTVVVFASPERTAAATKSMAAEGYQGPGHLEYWPKDETGVPGYEHPAPGKTVLEIYDPALMKDPKLLKEAIYGDLMHGMRNDPEFAKMRDEFKKNYTSQELKRMTSSSYAGGDASGGVTKDATHDAYIRGYLNPDSADEWRGAHAATGNTYSPKQLQILEQMRQYIKTGKSGKTK